MYGNRVNGVDAIDTVVRQCFGRTKFNCSWLEIGFVTHWRPFVHCVWKSAGWRHPTHSLATHCYLHFHWATAPAPRSASVLKSTQHTALTHEEGRARAQQLLPIILSSSSAHNRGMLSYEIGVLITCGKCKCKMLQFMLFALFYRVIVVCSPYTPADWRTIHIRLYLYVGAFNTYYYRRT